MEDVVNSGAGWKLQAYGRVVDDLLDAVGADVARLQLAGGRTWQSCRRPLSETKKGPVTDLVDDLLMMT
jgi:hypothetical protein